MTSTGDAGSDNAPDFALGDPGSSRRSIIYAETRRLLDRQATVLSELRNRANILLSANAVVATIFGAAALGKGHPLALEIIALMVFAVGVWACIAVILPVRDWGELPELKSEDISTESSSNAGSRQWQVTFEPTKIAALSAEAFADEGRYRRLKITDAGPSLSQLATFLRVGATEQVLRLAESSAEVPLDHRRYTSSIDAVRTQRAYLAAARRIRHRRPEDDIILDAWQDALDSHEDSQEPAPRSSDTSVATASQIESAVDLPPQTTRARLRGLFIKTATKHRQNFTVNWVHLKLNDQRTVRCSDPLNANFEPAQRLITSISGPPA